MIDPGHPDGNTLADLCGAFAELGATEQSIDETRGVIRLTLPALNLPIVRHVGGVRYVREVFHYLARG